ncbi:MAG: hypothetical protein HC925_00660, partial [Coleofasciculaceae cyanobacterium SM2_3_26]|nr:hypothetical protein [Coleofasciculaceae cyanobacterium SM2_3_26]
SQCQLQRGDRLCCACLLGGRQAFMATSRVSLVLANPCCWGICIRFFPSNYRGYPDKGTEEDRKEAIAPVWFDVMPW